MSEKRRDSKKRNLQSGESQRPDGRYQNKYTDAFGTPKKGAKPIIIDGYAHFLFLNRDVLPKTAANYDAMFKCLLKKYNKCHEAPLPKVMPPYTMRYTSARRRPMRA